MAIFRGRAADANDAVGDARPPVVSVNEVEGALKEERAGRVFIGYNLAM